MSCRCGVPMSDTICKLIADRARKRRAAARRFEKSAAFTSGMPKQLTAKLVSSRSVDRVTLPLPSFVNLAILRGGKLNPKQVIVRERLENAFATMRTRHGKTPEEIENDETFTADYQDFAMVVRAARQAGILNLKVLQRHPAAMAARTALPSLRHQRQKVRRIKPIEKRDPLRQLWTQHGKWLSGELTALREKGLSVEGMRGAVVAKMRRNGDVDVRKLAHSIVRMSREGWRKRVRSLLDG